MKYVNTINEKEFYDDLDCMYDVLDELKITFDYNTFKVGTPERKATDDIKFMILDYLKAEKYIDVTFEDEGSYTYDEFKIADEIYERNLDKKLLGD